MMMSPDQLPERQLALIKECPNCESRRFPRIFVCDYHSGWIEGYEDAHMALQTADEWEHGYEMGRLAGLQLAISRLGELLIRQREEVQFITGRA